MAGSMLIYWRVYLHMWWIQLILKSHVITHKLPFHSYKEWLDICSVASDPWPMMMSSVIRWAGMRSISVSSTNRCSTYVWIDFCQLYNRFFSWTVQAPFLRVFFPWVSADVSPFLSRQVCRLWSSLAWSCGPFYHFSYAWAFLGDDKSVPMKSGGHCVFPCICYVWTNPTRWHMYIYI